MSTPFPFFHRHTLTHTHKREARLFDREAVFHLPSHYRLTIQHFCCSERMAGRHFSCLLSPVTPTSSKHCLRQALRLSTRTRCVCVCGDRRRRTGLSDCHPFLFFSRMTGLHFSGLLQMVTPTPPKHCSRQALRLSTRTRLCVEKEKDWAERLLRWRRDHSCGFIRFCFSLLCLILQ